MLPLLGHDMQQSSADRSSQHLIDLFGQKLRISESVYQASISSPNNRDQTHTLQPTVDATEHSTSQRYSSINHASGRYCPQPYHDNHPVRLLLQYDIALSHLSSCQLSLFEESTPNERQKLIKLWRLAPPALISDMNYGPSSRTIGSETTTLEREVG